MAVERFEVDVESYVRVISTTERRSFRRTLVHWYRRNGRDLPWRRTRDPYAILVSEVMLQQTQVSTVVAFYGRWLERFPTVEALAAASDTEVLHAWQGLGYYRRAQNLHAASKLIVRNYDGRLPSDPEVLNGLPGMGRYTSNAVATFAFDRPLPIVEANITRVISRLFNIKLPVDSTAGRERLWQIAAELVPQTNAARFNSALMDLGALICTSRIPKCRKCPVRSFCTAVRPELLPVKKARPGVVRLEERHAFVRRGTDLLLQQCSSRWRGMWMLPPSRPRSETNNRPVHSSVFPFTHHRITLRVFRERAFRPRQLDQQWVPIKTLGALPIPSPHRRAITALLSSDVEC